jgi:hypothetical protein
MMSCAGDLHVIIHTYVSICIHAYTYPYIYISFYICNNFLSSVDTHMYKPIWMHIHMDITIRHVFSSLSRSDEFLNFCVHYLCLWLGLCVLRRTNRQDYETLFPVVILIKHHHHHHRQGVMKQGKDRGSKKEVRGFWSDVVASPYFSIGVDCETANKYAEGLFEIYNKVYIDICIYIYMCISIFIYARVNLFSMNV